jgi:hypothetical protein
MDQQCAEYLAMARVMHGLHDGLPHHSRRAGDAIEASIGAHFKESVGDHVATTDFTDVKEHHGSWILSAAIDGEYDKTGLPDPVILTYYFTLDGGKIASLIIVANKPGY